MNFSDSRSPTGSRFVNYAIFMLCGSLSICLLSYTFGVLIPSHHHQADLALNTLSQQAYAADKNLPTRKEEAVRGGAEILAPAVLQPAARLAHNGAVSNDVHHHAGVSKTRQVSALFLQILSEYAMIAMPQEKREGWWLNMGHIGEVPKEVHSYSMLANSPGIKTICEIGFNAGHSVATLLHANPKAVLYAFDFGGLPYSNASLSLFRTLFKERFHYVKGDSRNTVPWFRNLNVTCDMFSVDGDHGYDGCLADYLNILKVMQPGGLVVGDDITDRFSGCKRAWSDMVRWGYFSNPMCEVLLNVTKEIGDKGWCHAKVAKTSGGPMDQRFTTRAPNMFKLNTF